MCMCVTISRGVEWHNFSFLASCSEEFKSTVVTTFTMCIHLHVSVAITPHWKVL